MLRSRHRNSALRSTAAHSTAPQSSTAPSDPAALDNEFSTPAPRLRLRLISSGAALAVAACTAAGYGVSSPATPTMGAGSQAAAADQDTTSADTQRGVRDAAALRGDVGASRGSERNHPVTALADQVAAERAAAEQQRAAEAERVAAEQQRVAEAERVAAEARRVAEAERVAAEQQAAQQKAAQQEAARQQAARQEAAERVSRSASRDPRSIARAMVAERGWGEGQFGCLESLWTKESGWDHTADNPTSSAYGIPQALPGSKMASAGADWESNPATQIRWGMGYIAERYGSPCSAWEHSQANNWY